MQNENMSFSQEKYENLLERLSCVNDKLNDLSAEFDSIKDKRVAEVKGHNGDLASNLIESLPLESLYDLCEKLSGKELSRATFKDLMRVAEIKRKQEVLSDERKELDEQIRMHNIEVLEERIREILGD